MKKATSRSLRAEVVALNSSSWKALATGLERKEKPGSRQKLKKEEEIGTIIKTGVLKSSNLMKPKRTCQPP